MIRSISLNKIKDVQDYMFQRSRMSSRHHSRHCLLTPLPLWCNRIRGTNGSRCDGLGYAARPRSSAPSDAKPTRGVTTNIWSARVHGVEGTFSVKSAAAVQTSHDRVDNNIRSDLPFRHVRESLIGLGLWWLVK